MKMPDFAKIFSFSKKESSVIKNSALTKTLSSNPSLRKSFENNPQLFKTMSNLQKDEAVIEMMKSLEKSPSMNKLKTVLNKNPSALTQENVKKLGAAVLKPSRKIDQGTLFACGLMLVLLILVGAITIAVTTGSAFS
ncbi:hypothetical protein PR001_g23457 [Phytophthora rubi]|nr:hypothetical protein PR002_g23627 [Phytophthora rubi]KAE8983392.1 hypothetical protein PR001_g23457 [Phytophthora rubi]